MDEGQVVAHASLGDVAMALRRRCGGDVP